MKVAAVVVLWALMCAAASAQDVTVPARLSLADAIRIAEERNPRLQATGEDVEIARGDRITASRRLNPAFTFSSEGYPLFESPRPNFFNNQELVARVDQELETAGRRALRTKAAEAGVASAEMRLRDRRRLLELDVRRAYFQVALAGADQEVSRTALADIDRVINLNRARVSQGEISGAELRRLQVERLKFVDDVFGAELALRNAKSALLAMLNVPNLAQAFDVVEPLAPPPSGTPATVAIAAAGQPQAPALDVDALRQQALAARPDVLAIQQEELRLDTETELQRRLRTPNVTVGGGYKREFGANSVVVAATVPLPIFNRNPGGIARAEAERRRAAHEREATQIDVSLDVQQAVNAVEINQQRVGYIEREYLKNATESRDIVLASYRLGAADLIDFLDAQRAYRDTVRTYNRALYDLRISQFELTAAVGSPTNQP